MASYHEVVKNYFSLDGNNRYQYSRHMRKKIKKAALLSMATALRTLRKASGMSVQQLADEVGCTVKNIYHIERAENWPSMEVYIELCRVLKQVQPPIT